METDINSSEATTEQVSKQLHIRFKFDFSNLCYV